MNLLESFWFLSASKMNPFLKPIPSAIVLKVDVGLFGFSFDWLKDLCVGAGTSLEATASGLRSLGRSLCHLLFFSLKLADSGI